jgi:hypothetical protein
MKGQHLRLASATSDTLTCDDGSIWVLDPRDATVARGWTAGATLEARVVSHVAMWPYSLVNSTKGSLVRARPKT